MTPNEIAGRAAEAVMRKIEDTRRINKREITEAIEGELLRCQPQTSVFSMLNRPSLSRDGESGYRTSAVLRFADCGND